MKKSSLAGWVFLAILAGAVLWLDWREVTENDSPIRRRHADYILAISWQPAFCERRPNVAECRSQRKNRFDAENFSLHGLWPQPRNATYCDVPRKLINTDNSGNWSRLPKLDLSEALRRELAEKMPGYRSYLHRHQWYKHGTCMSGYTAEEYFRISLNLLDQVNASALRDLLASNIGERLRFDDLHYALSRTLGDHAADRMIVDCHRDDGRRIIWEFKLSLSGLLSTDSRLDRTMTNADRVGKSCPSGIVDAVGLQ
ncbi:MAG: ribonuclease T [Pseudomonadota bacterium]